MSASPIPPLPKGYTLDRNEETNIPPLPKGYTLDFQQPWTPPDIPRTATASDLIRAELPGFSAAHPVLTNIAGAIGDAAQGAGRELISQGGRLANYISPRLGDTIRTKVDEYGTPIPGTAETVGRTGLDVGEFMIPGEAEAQSERAISEALPKLPRLIRLGGELLPSAASTGAVNALQGGSFRTGAELGGAGGAAAKAAEELAPAVAESALGITSKMRGYGKTPGIAALEETSGISPEAVRESASDAIGNMSDRLRQLYDTHTPVSTKPAMDVLDDAEKKAKRQGNKEALNYIDSLRERLTTDLETGQPLTNITPSRLLDIKQGIGEIPNWNPNLPAKGQRALAMKVYKAIDNELDRAVPEGADINQKLSSLIDVRNRAGNEARNEGIIEGAFSRMAKPTGALFTAGLGGYEGARREGLGGALAGGAAGLFLPEIVANPSLKMALARRGPAIVEGLPKFGLGVYRGTSK